MSQPDFSMIVDVVDADNVPIGTARRAELFANKKNFRTVHALVFDTDKRLILQRLPPDHKRNPDKIGSSVAGYVQTGETYEEAAYRKQASELDLHSALQRVCEFMMIDEGCRKYVGLFVGTADRRPRRDPNQIADLVTMTLDMLQTKVLESPNIFTPTFLHVYDEWRARTNGS